MEKSLQETFGPSSICFGCGPSNPKGLRIRSFPEGEWVTLKFTTEKHHEAFPGMINGGIIGTLLDCHSNWTAAWFLYEKGGKKEFPVTVTADFHVFLKRPTPSNAVLEIKAKVSEIKDDRAVIDSEVWANGKLTATCKGLFVAVKEGHPAYHRWN